VDDRVIKKVRCYVYEHRGGQCCWSCAVQRRCRVNVWSEWLTQWHASRTLSVESLSSTSTRPSTPTWNHSSSSRQVRLPEITRSLLARYAYLKSLVLFSPGTPTWNHSSSSRQVRLREITRSLLTRYAAAAAATHMLNCVIKFNDNRNIVDDAGKLSWKRKH